MAGVMHPLASRSSLPPRLLLLAAAVSPPPGRASSGLRGSLRGRAAGARRWPPGGPLGAFALSHSTASQRIGAQGRAAGVVAAGQALAGPRRLGGGCGAPTAGRCSAARAGREGGAFEVGRERGRPRQRRDQGAGRLGGPSPRAGTGGPSPGPWPPCLPPQGTGRGSR